MNTSDFLNAILSKNSLTSDYQLHKHMHKKYGGWTKGAISNYRNNKQHPDDIIALTIAEELDYDPMFVIACIHAERAKSEKIKKVWSALAHKLSHAAAVILSSLMILISSTVLDESIAYVAQQSGDKSVMSIMLNNVRRWLRQLRQTLDKLLHSIDDYVGV